MNGPMNNASPLPSSADLMSLPALQALIGMSCGGMGVGDLTNQIAASALSPNHISSAQPPVVQNFLNNMDLASIFNHSRVLQSTANNGVVGSEPLLMANTTKLPFSPTTSVAMTSSLVPASTTQLPEKLNASQIVADKSPNHHSTVAAVVCFKSSLIQDLPNHHTNFYR